MKLSILAKTLLVGLAVGALAAAPAESAGIIDFDQVVDGGTLSGDFGVGGVVTGTDILFGLAKGVGTPQNNGIIIPCDVGCYLDFTTGTGLGEVAPGSNIYTFASGGTFVLSGEMGAIGIGDGNPATPDSEVILEGTFQTTTLIRAGGTLFFAASGRDIKNGNLVDFYFGLGAGDDDPVFNFSNTEISAVLGSIDGTTFTARVDEADLINVLPEPGSMMLMLLGLAGLAASRRRRS